MSIPNFSSPSITRRARTPDRGSHARPRHQFRLAGVERVEDRIALSTSYLSSFASFFSKLPVSCPTPDFVGRSYPGTDITISNGSYNAATNTYCATFTYLGSDPKGVDVSLVMYGLTEPLVTPADELTQVFIRASSAHLSPTNRSEKLCITIKPEDCKFKDVQIDAIKGPVIKDLSCAVTKVGELVYGPYDLRRFQPPGLPQTPTGNPQIIPNPFYPCKDCQDRCDDHDRCDRDDYDRCDRDDYDRCDRDDDRDWWNWSNWSWSWSDWRR